MQFTQPIWLWGMAAIAVPIVIHLWNVKQGKTLKVGSIAFLTESARAHAKSFRLSELLLLLLRCLLPIVIALLLSNPLWEEQVDLTKEKGWVLIERKSLKEGYNKFKPTVDSLVNAGYSFHYFEKGFATIKLEEALKTDQTSSTESPASYWTLLKELNKQVSEKFPVYIFTENSLNRFNGSRPHLAMNLKWDIYPSADTAVTWMENAFETTTDSVRVAIANSNANGTYYTFQNLSYQTSNEKFDVILEQGKTKVIYKDTLARGFNNTVEVDTSTLKIFIYTDRFTTDANYLQAALNALRDFTKQKIKTTIVGNANSIAKNYDWLFWLSENDLPIALVKNNVFVYEKGKVLNIHSTMLAGGEDGEGSVESLNVYKAIENKRVTNSREIWKNGYGEPLLVKEKSRRVYHFYSRLNPQWNDLPWSNEFPQIIYRLIYNGNAPEVNQPDKRIVEDLQAQPTIVDEKEVFPKESLLQKHDLTKVLWVVAFIIFLIERIVSYKSKKREVYGAA
ncbi:MAG: hypothetical protein JWQ96_2120 [Segetibacter sp.]|nr:hypothetical protein [Segetibacter sp.]